jgi:hypothetical protein
MKQLYTLNPDITSSDVFLEAYNKSVKTDNILKDLCNILFVDPRLYVYYTIKKYISGAVRLYSSEFVVDYMWNFVKYTNDFSGKIQSNRESRVRNILQIRYKRNMDPETLAKCEEVKQRIISDFKNNK